MNNPSPPNGTRRLTIIIVLAVLSVYNFPYLATTVALQSKQVPPSFAADLSLYLNVSTIGSSHVNPYFGNVFQTTEMGYMTFDIAFKLLGLVKKMADDDLWWTILIWNLFWWTAAGVGALWLLRLSFPDQGKLHLSMAMSLLFFFNFGIIKTLLLAWLRFPSLVGFDGLTLPHIRTVFPQTPLVLMFFYMALQIRALQSWRWYDWAGMCFVQAMAFGMFPYATLTMAGITFVAALADLAMQPRSVRLGTVAAYAALCALVDIAFLQLRLSGGAKHLALIVFRPSRALEIAGGGSLLLMSLTLLVAILPSVGSRGTKWTIFGLGFTNALLVFGDTVFSPALLVSHHGGYFIHTTIALEIVYLVSAAYSRFGCGSPWLRAACLATVVFATANGLILAFAGYRYFLPQNSDTNDLALALRSQDVAKGDLVIARAKSVDDFCSWVTLLSPAKVLFCRSAQYELSGEEKRGVYRLRQAFYLYFIGRNDRGIEQVATGFTDVAEQDRLAFSGEVNPSDKQRWDEAMTSIRTDLVPLLSQVEHRDGRIQRFFSPYRQILIVDQATEPAFVRERLSLYFKIESESRSNGFVFLRCKPLD